MTAYAMLYTITVGALVLLAAAALARLLRRHGRPERGVWLAGLVLAFALPAAGLLARLWPRSAAAGAEATAGVIGLPEVVALPAPAASLGLDEALLAAWLLASLLLAARWAVAVLRLERASRRWELTSLDGGEVWLTEGAGPAVAGTLRPRVIVPAWLFTLPARERALVLQHEREHIRARDPLVVAAARLARVLAPWNPVVWLLAARLIRAVELDCDRRVLRHSPDVRAYGSTLLEVSGRRPGRLVAVAAFAESEPSLRSRILSMTTPSRAISVAAIASATIVAVVLIVGALGLPVPTVRLSVELGTRDEAPASDPAPAPRPATPPVEGRTEGLGEGPGAIVPGQPADGARARSDRDLSGQPTFTPYTVAPSLLNPEDVQRALVDRYPPLLRDAGIGGTVTVWFFIDAAGTVQATRINESSGQAALDQAALDVASVFRFDPALNRDRAVPVWVSLPITFQVR